MRKDIYKRELIEVQFSNFSSDIKNAKFKLQAQSKYK